MYKLFLDTSQILQIGLLNSEYELVSYFSENKKQSATNVHGLLSAVLEEKGTSLEEINDVFLISGPGSYTGMRVGEGIAQIFEWQKKKIYSFFHFEIPHICGVETGVWIGEAYKGELFVYKWNGAKSNQKLASSDQFVPEKHVRYFSLLSQVRDLKVESTSDLLKSNSAAVFKFVEKRGQHFEPYYYRELEAEFTPAQR